ncbi:kinectin isoform X1 [Aphis gossypii]|uniref:kinectin isoform X1 n=2 Tax=Aphis gossypii TaxID=80765 RepID=UPI0021590A57|nr:kinectin isoform X1 [Aphis gossypii]
MHRLINNLMFFIHSDTMWSKTVTFTAFLWLLAFADFQLASAAQDATHEDIRTAIYSFAHSLRDNVDKLERHERREKQSGDQMQNMLLTIVNKQREQNAESKGLEMAIKGLEESMSALTNAETEETADRKDTKLMLDNLDRRIASADSEFKSILKAEQQSSNQLYQSFDDKLTAMSEQINGLQSRFDSLERAPKSTVTNDVIFELLNKMMIDQSSQNHVTVSEPSNATAQLVQETRHVILEAVKSLSDRMDDSDRKQAASDAKLTEVAKSAAAFQDDVQNSFRLMSNEVKTLSDVEKVLVQTADNVLDTKRRIEYGTHQILMEVTAVINDRSKELNNSVNAGLELAVKTVLDAQSVGMANLSVKIETEISQVWRQIGIMYQTLTDSASTLATLQQQTDMFVNSTATSVDGMNGKVSAIAGRMTEVDENLNYLLGRLSLVTQEFKEIKVGLGEALESIRVGLQAVQGNKEAVDLGPGPNPIDEELQSENLNPNVLSKTVYTVT